MSKTSKIQTSKFHRRTQATMSKRPMKVVPVGAWVELGPTCTEGQHEAIISAHHEEERIREEQRQKTAKLERFRRDVKHRVSKLHQEKRKQQLQESFQAVEVERNVIQQTSWAAERVTTKKNSCLYRNTDISIKQHEGALSSDAESEKDERSAEHLRDQSHEIFRMVRSAKRNLASKQFMPEKSVVPGGHWGESFTRDKHYPYDSTEVSSQSDVRIPQQPIDDITSYGDSEDMHQPVHTTESVLQAGGMSPPKTVTFNPNIGQESRTSPPTRHSYLPPKIVSFNPNLGSKSRTSPLTPHLSPQMVTVNHNMGQESRTVLQSYDPIQQSQPNSRGSQGGGDSRKAVTFDPVEDVVCERRWVKDGGDGRRQAASHRRPENKMVPVVKPGVQMEEHKKKMQSQYSMYRRLFMDIEREQVRENTRKKEHQKKINRLKKQKEQERQEVENRVSNAMEVRHPLTGETEMEAQKREKQEERYVEEMVEKQKQQQQKHKETQRYIRALRAMMKEKMDKQRITLPPLCACGPTVWDSNPETCANNCIFYRNPKAYAKALSSLLMSCQLD